MRDPVLRCFFIESFSADALGEALHKNAGSTGGIAFFALEHPVVRKTAAEVAATGTGLATILLDLGAMPDIVHVRLDSRAIGRIVALLIERLATAHSGAVPLVTDSRHYRTHSKPEEGFLSIREERFSQLHVIGMGESHDDASQNCRYTATLLDPSPDLVEIYNIGGSSGGITRALRERERQLLVFKGRGLTEDARRATLDGMMDAIFDEAPDALTDPAIRYRAG